MAPDSSLWSGGSKTGLIFVTMALIAMSCSNGAPEATPQPASTSGAPETSRATDAPPATFEAAPPDDAAAVPAPPSLRTSLDDVNINDPDSTPLPESFAPSAVPVDALSSRTILVDADAEAIVDAAEALEAQAPDESVITAQIDSCVIIVAWALAHPDRVVVGYEEHPTVQCVRAFTYTFLFLVPRSGTNSEGEWQYDAPPDVVTQQRVGCC